MKDKEQLILNISSTEDLNEIDKKINLKYINIDITNPNKKNIDYLLTNGHNFLYTENINGQTGYIYVDYNIFKTGQLIINEMIKNIPEDLEPLEKAKYIYIKLGKFIGYDINSIEEKNEVLNLSAINTINNLWGCMANAKGNNKSITELFFYLCKLINIECKIITINKYGYKKNILTINNTEIIVDLTQDIPYIQSGYKTRFFGTYNDDSELDKKIGYLKDDYSEKQIENSLKELDYVNNNFLKEILLKTQNIIDVTNMQPIELGIIYNNIFNKYCPNYEISINNLYINNSNKKEHFILITYDERHYSYNYAQNTFVEISEEELNKNIDLNKIGIYCNEKIPKISNHKTKTA